MSPLRRVLLTLALCVPAFAIGRAWHDAGGSVSPAQSQTPARQASHAPAVQAPCPDVRTIRGEAEALSRELGQVQAEILEGRLHDAEVRGLPVEWPPEADELWREASIEGLLAEALGETSKLLALDCSEYPCMAAVMPLMGVTGRKALFEESDRYGNTLKDAGLSIRHWKNTVGLGDDEYLMVDVLSFELREHMIPQERWRYRVHELRQSVEPLVDRAKEEHEAEQWRQLTDELKLRLLGLFGRFR